MDSARTGRGWGAGRSTYRGVSGSGCTLGVLVMEHSFGQGGNREPRTDADHPPEVASQAVIVGELT